MPRSSPARRVCYVTGSRAEFGLMRRTLDAIAAHPMLRRQVVVTGMHLDPSRGSTLGEIAGHGAVDAVVPWTARDGTPASAARAAGAAMQSLVDAFERLRPDIVLVTGDRIETFVAAAAATLSGRFVAHVHGGDRAVGQTDDSLRHAITKLAHLHLAATRDSGRRIQRLGEEPRRVHVVGAPGIERIRDDAASPRSLRDAGVNLSRRHFVLLVLHPTGTDPRVERDRAELVWRALRSAFDGPIAIVFPNTDPGADGIVAAWEKLVRSPNVVLFRHLPRTLFLGLLRDAAVLVGNSSSGIIESASFGTPVLDIGDRQRGRLCSGNVRRVPFDETALARRLRAIVRRPDAARFRGRNVYEGNRTASRIAALLATVSIDAASLRKLITY